MTDDRPVLFVTNHVPPDRAGAFRALHEREGIELALFGGRSHHATGTVEDPGIPHRRIEQRQVRGLAADRDAYRAVVCGTAGRIALPAAHRGARRAKQPFLLWSALWAQPVSPAHVLARPLLNHLYKDADAVVTYGPHATDHARRRGARNVHTAPQAVDNDFWGAPVEDAATQDRPFTVLFVGRPAPEKGLEVLRAAWRILGLPPQEAQLLTAEGTHTPEEVRNFYARADVLLIPSVASRTFREPWGLVANEAMNRALPVIASDSVGAAAGGLVRHGRNGLIVAENDPHALAAAIAEIRNDPAERRRLGANAKRDVGAFTFGAWAAGFAAALHSVGRSRSLR